MMKYKKPGQKSGIGEKIFTGAMIVCACGFYAKDFFIRRPIPESFPEQSSRSMTILQKKANQSELKELKNRNADGIPKRHADTNLKSSTARQMLIILIRQIRKSALKASMQSKRPARTTAAAVRYCIQTFLPGSAVTVLIFLFLRNTADFPACMSVQPA